jgi:nicotinate-nucleotide adenylyltransferase
MCELAAEAAVGVEACGLEIERGGTSYTVDTLTRIEARHPHAQLTFIVGADVAAGLPAWREPDRIARLARLAVVTRPGADRGRAQAALDAVAESAGAGARTHPAGTVRGSCFLEMPPVEVSSSLVRERVAVGEPIDGLVPGAVAAYIAEQGLYGAPPAPRAAPARDAEAAR